MNRNSSSTNPPGRPPPSLDAPPLPPDYLCLPELPEEALGELVRDQVIIEGRNYVIVRPDESNHLLDHPAVRSAFARDEYLPYWADLWPASRMLAKAILREAWTPATEALELGCGLGLPG